MYQKFLFITGILFDIIITLIGVLIRGGKEGNIFLKNIQPTNFMMFLFLASNLFFIPFTLYFSNTNLFKNYLYPYMGLFGIYRLYSGLSWIF